MKLLVDRLTNSPTASAFDGDLAWWSQAGLARDELEQALLEPVRFELEAYRMGENLYIEGTARTTLELGCSRCLARYRHPLRESFRVVLEPAEGRVPAEPDGAGALARHGMCVGDELEAGWYRGNQIDLSAYFQEVVALALPSQPLCREECRGLCPRCGVDRNTDSCTCEQAALGSPFAALRARRLGQGES